MSFTTSASGWIGSVAWAHPSETTPRRQRRPASCKWQEEKQHTMFMHFSSTRSLSKRKDPNNNVKGEVRRKMNFTYVLGFVVLRDVVKVFPVSSSSFARKTTGRNRARSHSGAWRGLKTKWDLKCLFRVRHISSDTSLSKSEQQLPSSRSTLSSFDSSGAWIFSHFRIQVRSADECVAPGRRQSRETSWTSDGRLSSPETNLKVGLLPLFFMQLLLSHMFLSFMVRTSPLSVMSLPFGRTPWPAGG